MEALTYFKNTFTYECMNFGFSKAVEPKIGFNATQRTFKNEERKIIIKKTQKY